MASASSPNPAAPAGLDFARTTALVIGAGASGRAAAELLVFLGARVRLYDQNPGAAVPEGVEPVLGAAEVPPEAFAGVELMVLSPGVPPTPFRAAQQEFAPQAQVHGEMSLSLAIAGARFGRLPTVLITGTNGKSTVTALTGALLAAGGRKPFVGGNLGVPLAAALLDLLRTGAPAPDALVLECSSFQLETLGHAATDVAMILNITPDHLDRYPTLEDYAATKARVFTGLDARGLALLDAGDGFTSFLRARVGAGRLVLVDDPDGARIAGPGPGDSLLLPGGEAFARAALPIPGRHNSKNALFALLAARHLGVAADACLRGLQGFHGLPHRMTFVRERAGVRYYDDSKATNVASVLASLDGFDRPFVLIAGGRAKGDDLSPLRELLRRSGRALVAIGESADSFYALAEGVVEARRASTMAEAVEIAAALAGPGDAVVLSPACASYDWFKNYGERGDTFARLVRALPAEK
ncbi:UDP-N-acetylmuramoyl-L-alanine--D-glutamate ligase [Nannocystis punicea]|uniref:UDP-N-acetylmuramoylalanine--D-glutamate ligase n=1 Tax=Nannocystis punicea TaxID=2995304 RepID=A0ABY7GYK9_9BACT|nr:UDP-N-acetylmuramoyl-L-alanine--D-glutamate ligase [Nannocystis poenicansa]WAS92083.1 UDP-N-acetylmuramoyl-L-alanine--D-glutamate ligase [Nannocystis poenicansa]